MSSESDLVGQSFKGEEFERETTGKHPGDLKLPGHLDLPAGEASSPENPTQIMQGRLISDSIAPVMEQRRPQQEYFIGQNCGIYWLLTTPRLHGAISPSWFYVPNVPAAIDGKQRRSYVMWQEHKSPLLVMEFVSRSGSEERDDTPLEGKFWIYEQAVQAQYYAIFDARSETLELYQLQESKYQRVPENADGRCPVPELEIELGVWDGSIQNVRRSWLRLWELGGNLIPCNEERLELALRNAEDRARQHETEAVMHAARLGALGLDSRWY